MRRFILLSLLIKCIIVNAQGVGIGTNAPNSSAQLDITSTTKGMLVPRVNTTQRTSIASPATGLLVFDNDSLAFAYYSGSAWVFIKGGGAAANNWSLAGNTGNAASFFLGTTDNNPIKFKVNNHLSGIIDPATKNIALGDSALFSNTGYSSIAIGAGALKNNTIPHIVAIGDSALFNNASIYNTAVGSKSLYSNANAAFNTAVGYNTLYANTTGAGNNAFGAFSLVFNTTGNNNYGFGNYTLSNNSTGSYNVAVGASLYSNTTGSNNSALGVNALYANTTGYSNVAMGISALQNNTTSSNLVAIGDSALYRNVTGFYNTALGSKSLYNNVSGSYNTAVGWHSLNQSTGSTNTALGAGVLQANNSGTDNAGVGVYSLYYNTTGYANNAVGNYALQFNSSGFGNNAVGWQALQYNTTGSTNAAFGHNALLTNTTGYSNVAIGPSALQNNTTFSNEVAVGDSALFHNNSGYANTALGSKSLYANTSGIGNTAVGDFSLYGTAAGTGNTAIGVSSLGTSSIVGNYNTAIGYAAGLYNGDNTTSIGYSTSFTFGVSNAVYVGNSSVTWIGGQVGWSTYSDERIKQDIQEDVAGLAFITKLKPVTYHLNIHTQNEMRNKNVSAVALNNSPGTNNFPDKTGKLKEADWQGKYDIEKTKMTGFLAQQVEQAAKDANYEFSGVQAPKNANDIYSLRYSDFVVPLVKAAQEMEQQIKDLQATVLQLKKEMENSKAANHLTITPRSK